MSATTLGMDATTFGIEVHLVHPTLERIVVGEVTDIMALYACALRGGAAPPAHRTPLGPRDLLLVEFERELRSDTDVNHHVLLLSRDSSSQKQTPQLDFYVDYSYRVRDTGRVHTLGGPCGSVLCKPAPTSDTASSSCCLKVFATHESLEVALAWLKLRYPWDFRT